MFRQLEQGVQLVVSVDEIVELLRQPGRTASHAATNCSRTDRVRHHPHHLQHGHQLARRQGPIQVNNMNILGLSKGLVSYSAHQNMYNV